MGLLDWYASIDPQYSMQQTDAELAKRKLQDDTDARAARQNLLSGQFDAQPAGLDQNTGVTWDTALPENVDAKKNLLSQINPQAATASDMNRFFPPAVDPDKRFKAVGDTLFDLNSPGGPAAVGTGTKPADNEMVNVIDNQKPDQPPYALTKAAAAKLISAGGQGRYSISGPISQGDKTTFSQMSPSQVKSWNLPEGTVAVMGSNGKPEIVNKPTGQDYFSGMPNGATGSDAYNWVSTNLPGGAEIAGIAQKVAAGKMLQPPLGRPGSIGEKVDGLLALAEPGYDQKDMKARFQLTQELNNQGDKALGGKLNSVSKIVNHSAGLLDSAMDLDNSSLTPLNYVSNFGKKLTSNEALRAFKKNQEGLGNEFEKLSGGGVAGQQARSDAADSYSSTDGITGTLGSVGKTIDMMEGQLDPMVANYNRVYNTNLDTDGFVRTVMNQPAIADKLKGMKDIVAGYKQTRQVDYPALAALTGRTAPQTSGAAPNRTQQTPQYKPGQTIYIKGAPYVVQADGKTALPQGMR